MFLYSLNLHHCSRCRQFSLKISRERFSGIDRCRITKLVSKNVHHGCKAHQKADRFRSIENSMRSAFARCCAIRHLKNFPEFSPSGLQFHYQRTKWVHYFTFFAVTSFLLGRFQITSAAKEVVKSGTSRGLVRTVIFRNRSLPVSCWTYQPRAETSAR
jgi:hypothetical protein